MSLIIAVDTGGTFTDIASFDMAAGTVACAKALTTYGDLVDGVMTCVERAGADLSDAMLAKHGTTLVINTLLQRNGARAALVTTKGFRDTLELARGNRTSPFRIDFRRDAPLIPRPLRFEIDERIHGRGEVFRVPEAAEVAAVAEKLRDAKVEAVAVSFLNAYLDDAHESAVAEQLREMLPGVYVTAGTELTREWYEYERCCTAAANAIAGPRMAAYAERLQDRLADGGFAKTLYMMGSNGGVLSVERTLREPIALIESGPVGGCIGAGEYGKALGLPNLIAFDMGGTTAKCAVVRDGSFALHSPYFVGGYGTGFPIRGSVVDIVEVGAGGGSIAWVDEAGRLHVGPRSAGSDPGPVAFGRGGTEPTVTDANLTVGRIGDDVFLGGGLRLDKAGAKAAIAEKVAAPLGLGDRPAEETADGILRLAIVSMTGAIRQVTVERGFDPRDFALFVFGGSGPIYGAALARELGMSECVIPPEPGNFSAIGMLLADARIDVARTLILDFDTAGLSKVQEAFDEAGRRVTETLTKEVAGAEIAIERSIDMRYRGQKHTFTVPLAPGAFAEGGVPEPAAMRAAFEEYYRGRFGHSDGEAPVEIVGLHVSAFARTPKPLLEKLRPVPDPAAEKAPPKMRPVYFGDAGGWIDTPVWRREALGEGFAAEGPLVIEEYGSTTVIGPGDGCRIGALGEIRIRVGEA
jgi:N-methylhydantoinase A